MLIATWITAISTLIMGICAIIALTTWKKEFKTNKICEIYEKLIVKMFEIEKFLSDLYAIYEKEEFCNEKLENFSNDLKQFSVKLATADNTKLSSMIHGFSEDLIPIKFYSKTNEDGSRDFYRDTFIELYFKNTKGFKNKLDKNISKFFEYCQQELKKFYK